MLTLYIRYLDTVDTIELDPEATYGDLKRRYRTYRLIFGGTEFTHSHSTPLADTGISNESTLYLEHNRYTIEINIKKCFIPTEVSQEFVLNLVDKDITRKEIKDWVYDQDLSDVNITNRQRINGHVVEASASSHNYINTVGHDVIYKEIIKMLMLDHFFINHI